MEKCNSKIGKKIFNLAELLFPICRSLTGNGVRQTLEILKWKCPELNIVEVPSGTQAFDWTVPKEWNIKDGYIKTPDGNKLLDFKKCNLHIMGYSIPIHKKIKKNELLQYIYTEPSQPDVVPYVTSYYKERFGFCMTENQRKQIESDFDDNVEFEIHIDSTLEDGHLTYGELIIPPVSVDEKYNDEIFISTYICHPSMANNELSGPCLSAFLADWVKKLQNRRYTYRFVFIPETIGSIVYLSKNLDILKQNMKAGFNISCVGDDRTYSYLESRYANTLSDKVIQNVLKFYYPEYKRYPFLKSGSDERRYNSPSIDLPVIGFSRSLYGEYPEYHTSADNLSLISSAGLQGSFDVLTQCILALENNHKYRVTTICEPQLGRRGLYPSVSKKGQYGEIFKMINFLAYADGSNDLIEISNIIGISVRELLELVKVFIENDLIEYDNNQN
jgi:aminopeptidase-like protein